MGYSFLEFMKRIGIFIVCAQSFLHFAAGKSYEKYIKLLIGIMILAQFIVPLRAMFLDGESAEIWEEIEQFQAEMEQAEQGVELTGKAEENGMEQLEKEMEGKLADIAGEYGYFMAQVKICDEPPKVTVSLNRMKDQNKKIKVEKITIADGKEDIGETEENSGGENTRLGNGGAGNTGQESGSEENTDRNIPEEMKHRFAVALGIDETYIEIGVS